MTETAKRRAARLEERADDQAAALRATLDELRELDEEQPPPSWSVELDRLAKTLTQQPTRGDAA